MRLNCLTAGALPPRPAPAAVALPPAEIVVAIELFRDLETNAMEFRRVK
jgi:hypothetical protein